MTRSPEEVAICLELRSRGRSVTEIALLLGIPRPTINDWVAGRVPRRAGERGPACERCGSPPHAFHRLSAAYCYLLGLYLGDGSIATHPRAFRLRITLDARYPGIVNEAASSMQQVVPHNSVYRLARPKGDIEVSSYSKAWPCLFPQHGPGKKHLRRIWLADWQWTIVERDPRPLLRGLIHSDGCRFISTGRNWRHPRYSFMNLSDDIRGIFTDACDLLGFRWTRARNTIYVSRKADVAAMDEFIGPKT